MKNFFCSFFVATIVASWQRKNARVRAEGGTLFALLIMVSIKMGLMENAEKKNIERKTSKMNFFCAINSKDKKILYLINDKKKDNRKDMTIFFK
jgi:hypothetical protein